MNELPTEVDVRRSARRRRTVSAVVRNGKIVVMIPASFTRAQEEEYVASMVARLRAKQRKGPVSDERLAARARELSERYLAGRAQPSSVRWVANQTTRWGSCTPATGAIRISEAVRVMPTYVRDYVLVHELAHLLARGHGEDFWTWVHRYPQAERAIGYLQGYAHAARLEVSDDGDIDEDGDDDDQEPLGDF